MQPAGPPVPPSEVIEQTHLTQKVHALLRAKIVANELRPGERVHVDQLAKRFGVSRTPVKDALSLLAAEGLVEIAPRRGTFVARLDSRDLEELYQVRLMIETFTAELVVQQITEAQLAELRRLLDEMERCIDGDRYTDFTAFLERDLAFHSAIVGYLGNRRLTQFYEGVTILARAYQGAPGVSGAQAAHRAHLEILSVLASGDPARVRAVLASHIRTGQAAFLPPTHRGDGRGS